jgi:hypothetical protein
MSRHHGSVVSGLKGDGELLILNEETLARLAEEHRKWVISRPLYDERLTLLQRVREWHRLRNVAANDLQKFWASTARTADQPDKIETDIAGPDHCDGGGN